MRAGRWRELLVPYAMAALAGLVAIAGSILLVEMIYRLSEPGASTLFKVLGVSFDARSAPPWFVFAAVLAAGLAALRVTMHRLGDRWGAIQLELQAKAA